MNFKKNLVAINHSPATAIVFAKALELAQTDPANLMIGHSIELASSSQVTVNLINGFAELVAGSVSDRVVHHTPCSVVVVQGQ